MEERNIQSKMGDGRYYHDCLGTAYTRAMNRAISNIIGSAEVSDEEKGGTDDDEKEHRDIKVAEAMVVQTGIKVKKPSWDFNESLLSEGWENAVNITRTFLENMGLDAEAFDIQVDAVKVTAKSPVKYSEETFKEIDEILTDAGFNYVEAQRLWRFNKPEAQA